MPTHLRGRGISIWIGGLIVLAVAAYVAVPWFLKSLRRVSTDDAYVNGHVTLVAPRVGGQLARVLVDDNNVVKKGGLLVELDPEPYQVQVNIAQAAVTAAEADLFAARASVRPSKSWLGAFVSVWNMRSKISTIMSPC